MSSHDIYLHHHIGRRGLHYVEDGGKANYNYAIIEGNGSPDNDYHDSLRQMAKLVNNGRMPQSGQPYDFASRLPCVEFKQYRFTRDLKKHLFINDKLPEPDTITKPYTDLISKRISELTKEINSFWPYPNKDIKLQKIFALDELKLLLLHVQQQKKDITREINSCIETTQKNHPLMKHGSIGHCKTSRLLNELLSMNKPETIELGFKKTN